MVHRTIGEEEEEGRRRRRRRRRGFICEQKHASVCKLTRRSPNAVARRRPKPQVDGTRPRPPEAGLPAECCWLGKVTGRLSSQGLRGGGRIPKGGLARATNPNSGVSEPGTPVGVGWNTHGPPKEVPPDRPKGGGGGERLIKDLERKANSLARGTRQASALGGEGGPPPHENCSARYD